MVMGRAPLKSTVMVTEAGTASRRPYFTVLLKRSSSTSWTRVRWPVEHPASSQAQSTNSRSCGYSRLSAAIVRRMVGRVPPSEEDYIIGECHLCHDNATQAG